MSRTQPRRPAKQSPVMIAAGRAVESLERRVLFAAYEWTGSADSLFSNAANWTSLDAPGTVPGGGDDTLTFPAAATNKTLNQDIANLAVTSLTFSGAGYTLGGANAIALNGGDVNATHTTGTTTVDTDLTLAATADINPAAGATVVVNGDVNNGGFLFRTIGDGDVTLNGVISGAGGLTRTAGGNTTLTADNTYAGDTSVIAGGDLIVSDPDGGTFGTGGGDVTVAGALRGDGTVGDVDVTGAGDVFVGLPGTTPPPAILNVESLTTTTGSVLRFNVNGATTAGTDYDQLVVSGTTDASDVVELGGTSLILDLGAGFTSTAGNTLTLVSNAGADPISGTTLNVTVNSGGTSGTPAALADGGTVTLGGRTYTADFSGGDGNDFVLTDTTGGGGGGDNQAPVNTVPAAQTVQVGEVLTFNSANSNAITVADPDAGTADVQVTLTSTGGTLNLASETGLDVTDADGDNSVVFTGTLAEVNAALNGLTYTPGTAGSGTLTIATSDQGNTGTGGAQTDTDNVAITISPDDGGGSEVNQPPVNAIPAAQTVATGQVLTFNTANANAISVSDPDAGTGQVQVLLEATNGTLNLASETGLDVNDPDGDARVAFTGPIASVNAALNGLTFTPTAAGPGTIQITTNDQGNTGTGGSKIDTDTLNITVGTAGTVEFDAANVEVNEGAGVATVTVTRSDSAAAASVDWAIATGGTATGGDDYVDGDDDDTGGTITFAPGAANATFLVAISDDTFDEANETINLALSNPTGTAALGDRDTATITINDDDPTPTLRVTDVAAPEGDEAGGSLTFTVLLSAPSNQPVTVAYATTGGDASAGQDYTNTTGTLTFAPGETSQEIEVPIAGDAVGEATETFTVALSDATNATVLDGNAGTGTGTIVDDDGSQIGIFVSDVVVTEGNEGGEDVTFTVGISQAPTAGVNVTVDYATSNGTGTAGEDYGARNGTLTFSGDTTEQTITIPVTGDGVVEALEAFTLTLSNASNAQLAVNSAQGIVVNDDVPVGVSIDNVTVTEGDAGTANATFTVTLSEASLAPLTVQYATADQSATQPLDYTAATGTLSFAAGETSKTIIVPIVGDTTGEPTQTFVVTLTEPSDGLLLTDALGVGTIEDNDDGGGTDDVRATDDQVTRPQGTAPVTINVLANDTQFTGNNLTVEITDQPSGGTAVVNSDNTITYTPAAAGPALPDFLTYRVSNGDDSGTAQVTIFTTGAIVGPDPSNPSQTALFVAGTSGADKITIGRKRTQLRVRSGREDLGLFDIPTGSVVVVGGDGDDRLAAGAFRGPVRIYGGNGNDRLNGGRFSDVLIGGAGDDTLKGSRGRNILIGGIGTDKISGGGDEDIVIAGSTDFDLDTEANRAALADILTAWNGAAAYAARVTAISAPAGVGTSGAGFNVGTTDDDTVVDRVNGGGGDDLFFANEQGGTAVDRVSGRKATRETLVDLTNN